MAKDLTSNDYNVIWEPLEGSQELVMSCPCNHILYDGTRGPGKTDAQLMYFRRFVGIGYGQFWRGVIFDREYKNLDDLISKSKRWFHQFGDGAVFLASAMALKWVWPTGEELWFRTMKDESDYWDYHGHEFCLEVNEEVITDKGDVKIGEIKVGDKVLTPSGYKKVTKVFPRKVKPCNKVSFYDKDLNLISSQRQSTSHRLLTSGKGWHLSSSHSSETVPLLLPENHHYKEAKQSRSYAYQESQKIGAYLEDVGNCGEACRTIPPIPLRPVCSITLSQLRLLHHILLHEKNQPAAILSRMLRKSFSPLSKRMAKMTLKQMDLLRQSAPYPLVFYLVFSIVRDESLNVRAVLQKAQDYIMNCFSCYGRYGELARMDKGSVLYDFPLLRDAQDNNRSSSLGDRVGESSYNHLYEKPIPHPYQEGKLIHTDLVLTESFSKTRYIGLMETVDITVEDDNCYFSTSGALNKNCFIGWNELTKYPNGELYDMAMSLNRSSFIPEKHNKALPEIPLVVFSTTNPYGVGHNWVKKKFIKPAPAGTVVKITKKVFNPRTQQKEFVTKTQVRIFGSYRENKYLSPEYILELESIKDVNRRKAWRDGDWDITSGGAIDDLWNSDVHIVPRFVIPESWRIDRSYDDGSSHPFSVGWWAEADGTEALIILPDGTEYTFCPQPRSLIQMFEWYGAENIGSNKGLKMSASKIAEGINDRELSLKLNGWISTKVKAGPADNRIRQVIDSALDTTEKMMLEKGVSWEKSDKSAGSRIIGLQVLRDRLESSLTGEGPGIYFMNNCEASIELLPGLPRDTKNLDDVDTTAEDHTYDMTRYRVLAGADKSAAKLKLTMPS